MKSLETRFVEVVALYKKMIDHETYCEFVREWRKLHDSLVMVIIEHKAASRQNMHMVSLHQAILTTYSSMATAMYELRTNAKKEYHTHRYAFGEKTSELDEVFA